MLFDDDRDFVRFLPGRWRDLGVSRRTWRRWMDGKNRTPAAVVQLARILVKGDLIQGGDAWRGWALTRRGELIDPAGVVHTPATITAWHWTAQQLAEMRRRENTSSPDELPPNVSALPTARRGHTITRENSKRTGGKRR